VISGNALGKISLLLLFPCYIMQSAALSGTTVLHESFSRRSFVTLSSAVGEFGLPKGARVDNKRRGQLAPKSALSEINVSIEHTHTQCAAHQIIKFYAARALFGGRCLSRMSAELFIVT
jgi:hypothetical protein